MVMAGLLMLVLGLVLPLSAATPYSHEGIAMHRLVLLRHGQSQWNLENRFTGWWDVDLTAQGVAEAKAAGDLLAAKGFDFDTTFTSLQTRAIKTLDIALEAMGRLWKVVSKSKPFAASRSPAAFASAT